jgi:hypothetical protein
MNKNKIVKMELTEEQMDLLEPLFEAAFIEQAVTDHTGSILIKMATAHNPRAVAYYFPYEDAKYLQAITFVARKGKAISDFMTLKKGEEQDE